MNERELFLAALEIDDPTARQAHLQSACAGDAPLLARVEALLASHEGQSQFLNVPVVEQLVDDAVEKSAVTLLFGSTTTADDGLAAGASPTIGPDLMTGNDDPDAIPLNYLEPSSRPDSLGRLAHYEILEVLGQGAFGIVLKAFDEKLQRVVAIKVLSPHLAATSPSRKRFLREARASGRIRHENVVSIYAVEDESLPYLVMEYIPGETLQKRLDDHGPLDLPDVLRLGKQIADGLAAAHAQDLIHRDVKPGNILLDTSLEDHVKITDFGLARTADDASMTQSGMIAGTPLYMAPEQALGRKLDQRADLFSFGSVLYQMLSGRPPFRAPTTIAVLKRVTEDTPRPIQEIIPEVPDWMCELVGHLHAKQPDERYGSAKEVSKLLASCLADVEQGRVPIIPAPTHTADASDAPIEKVSVKEKSQPRVASLAARWPLLRVAALVLIVLLAGLGISEATGVSHLATTVIRLTTGSGTLVIETDDPGIQVTVTGDGDEVTIRGAGIEQLTLSPGKYRVAAFKDGKPVKQELVAISRNGKTTVRMSLEPPSAAGLGEGSAPDRLAAEWALSVGGTVLVNGSPDWINAVADLPPGPLRLTVADFYSDANVTDSGLANFEHCRNLTQIKLVSQSVSDAGMVYFKDCNELTSLILVHTEVGDPGLAHFHDCRRLEQLIIPDNRVTDAGLAGFEDCPRVRRLDLAQNTIGDAGLVSFKGCNQMDYLNLGWTQVSDEGLSHFAACKQLRELLLIDTAITDTGLLHLQHCAQLAEVHLQETAVSDTSVPVLAKFPKLVLVKLQRTNFTAEGVAALHEALPLCRIEWDGGVIQPQAAEAKPPKEAAPP